jgi:hypothetical protein
MDTLRYLNKNFNAAERKNFSNWWKEQILIYGSEITYFTNNSSVSGSNPLYGEMPDAVFGEGKKMIILNLINADSVILSKFGLVSDSDLTGVIHPDLFTSVFGLSAEPKRDDLIELTEYGIDRINYPKRGPTIYQLTDVVDEFKINALGGHYVWFFNAKRYDYSQEPNSPGAGVGNTPLEDNDIIEMSADKNFDYLSDNPNSNSAVYGEY